MLSGAFDNIQQAKKSRQYFKTNIFAGLGLILSQNDLLYEHSTNVVHYMLTYIYIVFKSYATILRFSTVLKDDNYHIFYIKYPVFALYRPQAKTLASLSLYEDKSCIRKVGMWMRADQKLDY